MTLQRAIPQGLPAGVLMVSDPAGFAGIREPGVTGLIWQRRPLDSFRDWIGGLDPEALPRARLILRPEGVEAAVTAACMSAGTPGGAERGRLIGDIAALADAFAKTMQTRWLRLRLEAVETNACRRFHVDRVTARLICTYRGTGTQFGQASEGGVPEAVHTVATGAPLVLRGSLWPAETPGLLHRSPPIEGTGETRLVLVLDPVTDPEAEA